MSAELPPAVLTYLASDSARFRRDLQQDHPDLAQRLSDPATRTALLEWLAADDREPDDEHVVASAIRHLRADAQPGELDVVRPFTLHASAHVRRRAYEFLLTLWFPDDNRQALLAALQAMLADPDDGVRAAAARYVARADAGGELATYLRQWRRTAEERGWAGTESDRLVSDLVAGGDGP